MRVEVFGNYFLQVVNMLKKFFIVIPILILMLSLSICISEPLSRNLIRILFLIAAGSFFVKRKEFFEIVREYKIFFVLMILFIGWMIFSAMVFGQKFSGGENTLEWIFFSHNMILFLPLIFFIRRFSITEKIFILLGVSLLIDDVFVAWQFTQGIERPITFLKGSFMQGTMVYVILLPALLILSLQKFEDVRKKFFYRAVFFVSLIAFILLNTRGPWIDLAIIFPLILIYELRDWKKVLSIAGIFLIAAGIFLAIFPKTLERVQTIGQANSQQSVTERFLMWRSATNMIIEHPLTGVGLGNYDEEYQQKYILPEAKEREQTHAHNIYLQLWAESGIFGLIFFCALFGYILFWSWQKRENFFGRIIFFSTLALMLYGLTDYTISGYRAMRIYWFLFGVCLAEINWQEKSLE